MAEFPLNLRKKIAGVDPGRDPLTAARLRVKSLITVFYSEEDDLPLPSPHTSVSPVSIVVVLTQYFFCHVRVNFVWRVCMYELGWASPSCSLISAKIGMCKIDMESFICLSGESLIMENNLTSYMCYRMYVPTLIYSFLLQGTSELDNRAVGRPDVPAWYDRWVQAQDVAVDRPFVAEDLLSTQPDATASRPFSKEELQESLDIKDSGDPPRVRRTADRPEAFKIRALDCRHPSRVRSTKVSSACTQPPVQDPMAEEQLAFILQRKTDRARNAVRCRKLVSSTSEICGRWGHVKLLTPPRVLRPQTLTEEACQQIVQSRLYIDEVGESHPIPSLNADIYMEHVLHGSLKYSLDDVRCTGEDGVKINGKTMNDVVVLNTVKLEVRTVTVTVRENLVEDEESGFQLVPGCGEQQTCVSGHDVFVFKKELNKCPYYIVRAEKFTVLEVQTPIDPHKAVQNDQHHLYLRLEGKGPPPPECVSAYSHQYQTDFKELVVVFKKDMDDDRLLDRLTGRAVDIQLEERVIDSYNDRRTAHQLHNLTNNLSQELCQISRSAWLTDTISPWHPDSLLRTRGEIIQELTCTPTDVLVAVGDHLEQKCYAGALPVTRGGERLLMEARTRVLFTPVAVMEMECSTLTSAIFEIEGRFFAADPFVREVDLAISPLGLSQSWHKGPEDDHSTYVNDLLYSREEIRSYNALIGHHPMKKHVVDQFAKEYCARSQQCGRYQPESGYFNMNHFTNPLSVLTWWDQLISYAQEAGQVCSTVVVAYLLFSMMYTVLRVIQLKFFQHYDARAAVNLAVMPGRLIQDYARQIEDQRQRVAEQEKPNE